MVRRRRATAVRTVVTTVRRRRRNRARRNRRQTREVVTERALVPVAPPQQKLYPIRNGRVSRRGRVPISKPGMAFLKCAFASPDFDVDPGQGIPDRFHGKTVTIKDCFTTSINFTAGNDTYIIVAPVPGYAYFTASVANGATPTVFTGVPYPTFSTNFGNTTGSAEESSYAGGCQYSAFRYASLAAGLYPTSNYMSFGGSISVWKADMSLGGNSVVATTGLGSTNVDSRRIYGLESVGPLVPRDNYTQSFIKGAFAIGFDMTGDFDWQPFVFQPSYYTTTLATDPAYKSLQEVDGAHALTGYGNTETIIMKISTPAGTTANACAFKTWNCIELKPRSDSGIYQFSHLSPENDEVALELYSRVKSHLPVAVCAAENESAWKRILEAIANIGGAVGSIPGPIGWIGSGVSNIARGISSLVF